MRRVCGDAVVGRSIPLWWVLLHGKQLGTWNRFYDHEYRAIVIARLASVGNLEACFYARMRIVFVEDHSALMPWQAMMLLHLFSPLCSTSPIVVPTMTTLLSDG